MIPILALLVAPAFAQQPTTAQTKSEVPSANPFAKPWHISLSRPDMLAAWGRLKNLAIPGIPLDQHFKIDGPAFYVSPNGSDAADGSRDHPWQTLQFAVTRLKSGTIIYLTAGTYFGPATIKTKSTEQTPAALRAVAGQEVVVTYSEDFVQQQKAQIARLDKEGAIGANGKQLHYASLITVAGAYVEVSGLRLVGVRDRLPMNLYSESGISLSSGGGQGCRILYNEIENTGHCGVKEMGHGGAKFLIEGNYIHDLGHTTHDHAIYLPCNDVTIRKNLLLNTPGWGIHAYSTPQRLTISHNIIGGHAEDAVILGGSDCKVFNNIFYRDNKAGVFFFRRGCRNNAIVNNIIVEPAAFRYDSTGSNALENQPQGNVIDYNCLVSGSIKSPPVDKLGAHNIKAEPQFLDAARLDFRLQPRSPCLDAGDPKTMEKFSGKAPAIGLYEAGE